MEYTGVSICLGKDKKILEVLRKLKAKIEADPNFTLPWLWQIHEQDVPHMFKLTAIAEMLVAKCKERNAKYRERSTCIIDWRRFVERKRD